MHDCCAEHTQILGVTQGADEISGSHGYWQIWVWWGSTALVAFLLRWWWEGRKWFPALLWQIVLITEDVTVIEGFKQNKVCASWNKPICFSFFSPSQMNFPCEINNLVVSKAFLLKRTIVWASTSCLSFSLRKIGQQVTPAFAITCLFEGTVAWWIWRCTLICNTFQSWI